MNEKISDFFVKIQVTPKFTLIWLTYTTFCATFLSKTHDLTGKSIGVVVGVLLALYLLVTGWIVGYLMVLMKITNFPFSRGTVVAHLFLGSQKTMTLAIPLIQILYADYPSVGTLVLPIVIYHSVESLLGGMMLFPLKKWTSSETEDFNQQTSSAVMN
eukprot:TRINITY_DN956_c0_g1_i15.p1 TRINITY_DN956_c0_g1~~TRINITY_DN956_c0_g1_i15.p1  ORF type:complete len:158 (+),score=32.08 TRINITY_DN956_c0_g1_i15:1088-1561(+)